MRTADISSIPINATKIRQLRKTRKLTFASAAKLASLPDAQTWYQIESGRRTNLTIKTLDRIAAALGVKAKDLLK